MEVFAFLIVLKVS